MLTRVLIIGYGKMGHIHGKHLSEMGVPWSYHDPFVPGGVGLDRIGGCTHAIIATPIDTHYDVYRALDGFPGRILIEKPVITHREHLHVLDDSRVFPGMSERFNPEWKPLAETGTFGCALSFLRAGPAVTIEDVAIHDLDLCCLLCGWKTRPRWWPDRGRLIACLGGQLAAFRWSRIETVQRTVTCGPQQVDLAKPRTAPIAGELEAFLRGDRIDARVAHEWLAEILKENSP